MTTEPQDHEVTPSGGSRRRHQAFRWVPVVGLAALIVAGCSSTKKLQTSSTGSDSSTVSSTPTSGASTSTTEKVIEFGKVTVEGTPLSSFASGKDTAVGKPAPLVVGQSFDGSEVRLAANGKPTVIFFLAHWCPHCNREVPALVADWNAHGQPAGVQLLSVTTGSNPNATNWPPSQWVKDEKWPVPVLADSERQEAATAFGLPAYPFFVMLKPDGTVFLRNSGEWPVSAFNAEVAALVKASGTS